MKHKLRPLSSLLLCAAVALSAPVLADEQTQAEGLRIAKERKAQDTGWDNSEAEMKMILRNAQGQEATREIRVKSLEMQNDGDKALTIFDSPRDVSGTAFLSFSHPMDADEQWIYLPAIKRVKRIASRNKSGPFMSSEFAFEDMTSFEVEKFSYDFLRDDVYKGDDVFVVEQTPEDEFSGYSKQIVWVDKAHYRVRKVEFFDRKDDLLKVLEFDEYTQYEVEGKTFWRPHRSNMFNKQTGKSTELVTEELKFMQGLEENDFDKNSLRRAR